MRIYLLILTCFLTLALPHTSWAANADPRVQTAETWLNALTTAQARFEQRAPDGSTATGTFYLQRPGRLRFAYDPPSRDFIVADGLFLYFYDGEQKQASSALIGSTLADFLLRPSIQLGGDLLVKNIRMRDADLYMSVTQKSDPGAGELTLRFDAARTTLKGWDVIDPQGLSTRITLTDMKLGTPIPPQLFVMPNDTSKNHLRR